MALAEKRAGNKSLRQAALFQTFSLLQENYHAK
jgi:hypothetical protein